MSLLARAKLSAGGRLFPARSVAALQQFYSTKTTPSTPKTARTQKPSQSPSSSLSERIKERTGSTVDWPKPIEIPYQARVANSVNLIGRVKTPVQFESNPDGNHFAAAVISQENGGDPSSLLIPVVFEGDLAHVVACHVKEKDRVFVSGQLSMGPMRFAFKDGIGKFHLVAENLNFVDGFAKNVSSKKSGVSYSYVEAEKPFTKRAEEVIEKVGNDDKFNHKWKEALEIAKVSVTNAESENLEHVDNGRSGESATKKKYGDSSLDLWRDLVKSPRQWWDFRGHKSNGLVKEKFPDFKHKETGDPLWISSAPDWVKPGLGKLEFDVKFMRAKPVQGGEGLGERKEFGANFMTAKQVQGSEGFGGRKKVVKDEDSWKDLVENPSKWWDNRLGKRNPKAPDFKHKETGQALWLSDSPDWALGRLPESKDGKGSMEAV